MRTLKLIAVSLGSTFLASAIGCVPEFDDDFSRIVARRILAVRAVPAEVKAGESFQLEVLVAAPGDSPAEPERIEWAVCVDRKKLTELGPVSEDCIDAFGQGSDLLVALPTGETTTGAAPADGCQLFGPIPVTDGAGVASRPVDPDPTGGYYLPIILGDEEVSLSGVRLNCGAVALSTEELKKFNGGYRPNENPLISQIVVEREGGNDVLSPEGFTVRAGEAIDFRAEFAACPRKATCGDGLCTAGEDQVSCADDCRDAPVGCTGAESYFWANAETRSVDVRREAVAVAWYADGGQFENEQTGQAEADEDKTSTKNHWVAPAEPGTVHLWLVIRDDRGGVGYERRTLTVE